MSPMINHLPEQKNKQIPITSVATGSSELNSNDKFEEKAASNQPISWQTQVADVITDIDQLLAILELSDIKSELYIPKGFGLRVPKAFVAKMKKGDPKDPLLLQVLPSKLEQAKISGYVTDPLAENEQNPIKGLLHKYHSRVLVTVTGACAIHCRYCFRQHFDYQGNRKGLVYWTWYKSMIGKSCKGRRCPHFGTMMHERDGKLICPLHNLEGDIETELIINKPEVDIS